MRLSKVVLNNFRCFESLELELHPRLTVLVGENAVGKTTILDAIAVGLSPVLRYLSSANQRLSGVGIRDLDIRTESWGRRGEQERWGACDYAQVIVETTSGLSWDTWKASAKGKQPKIRVGESELSRAMASILESFRSDQCALLPILAYYGAQRGYIEIPQRLRAGNQHYNHPASALVGALDARSDFREMLQWFDLAESAELRANKGCRPEDYEEGVALGAVRVAIEQVLGGSYRNPHFSHEHKFVVDAKQGPSPIHVSQLSQGYQSMLALAMDFARRLAIGNGHAGQLLDVDGWHIGQGLEFNEPFATIFKELDALDPNWHQSKLIEEASFESSALVTPGIMLIDEIDLHLHPSWQQRVLRDLMSAFPTTQFIVTTHSPQVLTTVPSECIRILRGNKVYSAPPGTEGSEPERMLKQVLGLENVRPATNPATQELREYLALVDRDQWNSPRALELRSRLDARYQGQEPALLDADLQIENRKWELGE